MATATNVYCITCRTPLRSGNEAFPGPLPAAPLAALYQDDNVLVICVGGCGRGELFPCFLQVGLYCCTACTALILELSEERTITDEQESHQATQPHHPGD